MNLAGLGIDLIDLDRVRKFLKTHSHQKISRLLSAQEKKVFKRRRFSALLFAKFFAAKEAYFKTLNEAWMGMEGFASMDVKLRNTNTFQVKLISGALGRKGSRPAEGCFFYFSHYVGAQVINFKPKDERRWKKDGKNVISRLSSFHPS